MFVPDALSRLLPTNRPARQCEPTTDIGIETVDCVMHMSDRRLEQFHNQIKVLSCSCMAFGFLNGTLK